MEDPLDTGMADHDNHTREETEGYYDLITCPGCGIRWYYGLIHDEAAPETVKRMAEERARGIYWSGGCMPPPVCEKCGADLLEVRGSGHDDNDT